jgi:hypothetical protein
LQQVPDSNIPSMSHFSHKCHILVKGKSLKVIGAAVLTFEFLQPLG